MLAISAVDRTLPRQREPVAAGLRAVDRAVSALRRGEAIVLTQTDGTGALVLALEVASPEALAGLPRLTGTGHRLVVSRRRAAAVGHVADGPGVVALSLAGEAEPTAVADLIEPGRDSDAAVARLAVAAATAADDFDLAAFRLVKLARLLPAAAVGDLAEVTDADAWAHRNDLLAVSAVDVSAYQEFTARGLTRVVEARVPLAGAEDARLIAFRAGDGGPEHLAIVIGAPDPATAVLTRLHSECFTGDLLGSLRCDCGEQLRGAVAEISRAGSGLLLYLRQEGRGIGLVNKLRAYRLQDGGLDTIDANGSLGFEADERVYLPAAEMLRQLGIGRIRLLTNNPEKVEQLQRFGIEVAERVAHAFPGNGHNERYLRAKAERAGHLL
ncbi:MAG: GTP cyclohydrolase II [Azospirillum sp.]|nr:GTP cyclohydrolase II [Azospirillum sp.]